MNDGPDEFSCELDASARTLRVRGPIDMETSEAFAEAVTRATAVGTGPVVLDLAGVTFMDSSGLTVLVNITNDGHHLAVRNAAPVVRRVIEATGLDTVVEVQR